MKTIKITATLFRILIFVFTVSAFSQVTQNIKGIVVDKQSEYPLPDANVFIVKDGQKYGAITNFDGEYIIEHVPIGKINITATYNGFNPQSFTQLNLNSGKELTVNFSLLEKLESLNEVVIQGSAKRESVTYVTASAASFNVDQTAQYAGSLNDVSRMAMNYAGVSGNDDTRNDIIVRGNNPASLLWLVEGASIPSPNHYSTSGSSGGPVSMLNINTLSKSDFLSGAFPANFGNTSSAAFDLQFRKPNNTKTEFVGQLGFSGLELGVEGPFSKKSKASYLVNYRYSTLALFDAMGFDLGVGTAVPKYQDVNAIINIPTKKMGEFKLWTISGISHIEFENEGEDNNLYFDQEQTNLLKKNKNILAGLTHKYFFNKRTSSKISASYSNIDEVVEIDTLNNYKKFDRSFDMDVVTQYATIDAKINSKINKKNKVTSGVAYTNYTIDLELNSYTDGFLNKLSENTGLSSIYANWQHRFTDDLVVNSGMRYQYFALNKQGSLEPRLGLKYQVKQNTSLSIAYGLHSNINPLLSYFTKQEIGPYHYENRNMTMGFVKAHHFITGINQQAGKLKLKLEAYYQYLFDVPISHRDGQYSIINSGFNATGGSQLVYDELFNEGNGKNYGLDLTIEYPLKNGFYTLLTSSLYESKYVGYDNVWRDTAWNGNYMMSLLSGKEIQLNDKSSLGLDMNLNLTGGRRTTPINIEKSILENETVRDSEAIFKNKLEGYFRTDVKISYKRNGKKMNQEWQVDLRNLTNRKNIFSDYYSFTNHKVKYNYQTGFLPVVQYRILF